MGRFLESLEYSIILLICDMDNGIEGVLKNIRANEDAREANRKMFTTGHDSRDRRREMIRIKLTRLEEDINNDVGAGQEKVVILNAVNGIMGIISDRLEYRMKDAGNREIDEEAELGRETVQAFTEKMMRQFRNTEAGLQEVRALKAYLIEMVTGITSQNHASRLLKGIKAIEVLASKVRKRASNIAERNRLKALL